MSLQGKTVFITGGSRGIGKAIAHRLAAEGASVAICSRPQPGLADLGTLDLAVSDLQVTGSKIVGIPFDLSDPSNDLSQLVATVEQELGKRLGQLGLSNTCRAGKDERTRRTVWVL